MQGFAFLDFMCVCMLQAGRAVQLLGRRSMLLLLGRRITGEGIVGCALGARAAEHAEEPAILSRMCHAHTIIRARATCMQR